MDYEEYEETVEDIADKMSDMLEGMTPSAAAHVVSVVFYDLYKYIKDEADIPSGHKDGILAAMLDTVMEARSDDYFSDRRVQ